eukprot:gene14542-14665_t
MTEKLTLYDPAEDLASDAAIATFMAEAFETEDAGYIAHALGVVARAKGMSDIARDTGLSREQLYRSFSAKGNPTLKTTLAVMKALGLELTAKVLGRLSFNVSISEGRQAVAKNWFGRKLFGIPVWFGPNTWQGGLIIFLVLAALAVVVAMLGR